MKLLAAGRLPDGTGAHEMARYAREEMSALWPLAFPAGGKDT